MFGLEEIKQANEVAAAKELAELRKGTARGLRHAYYIAGGDGVLRLLIEALGERQARDLGFGARIASPENPVREDTVPK